MTDLEQLLREELTAVADTAAVPLLPAGDDYRAMSARRVFRGEWLAAAAAALVVVAAGVLVAVVRHSPDGVPSASTPFATWPTRGSLANDTELIAAAARTWEAQPLPARELPHRDVHALFATHTSAGITVVLTGVDALGHRRVAWLNTNPASHTVFRNRLHLIADKSAPTGKQSHLLVLYGPPPQTRPATTALVIALAPPSTRMLMWQLNDHPHWQPFLAQTGAGVYVISNWLLGMPVRVRAGKSGHGVYPFNVIGGGANDTPVVDNDWDPEEITPSNGASAHTTCHGNVCTTSLGGSTVVPRQTQESAPGWHDLRDPDNPFNIAGKWWLEPADSVDLLLTSRFGDTSGMTNGPPISAVLPDGTGIYLEAYTPSGKPGRMLFYVDRPEWYAGRAAVDIETPNAVPALGVVAPVRGVAHLVVVATDGLRLQWSANNRDWHDVAQHNHIADTAVPNSDASHLQWRALDANGATVAQGPAYTGALQP